MREKRKRDMSRMTQIEKKKRQMFFKIIVRNCLNFFQDAINLEVSK